MSVSKKAWVELAVYAGEIMLKNGAETYRVEDTIVRICNMHDIYSVESFVTPTGIFVSVNDTIDGPSISFIKRIKNRTINLSKISQVNDFSRRISSMSLSFEERLEELKKIDNSPRYNKYIKSLGAGIASAFFAVLIMASMADILISFIIGVIVYMVLELVDGLGANQFIQNSICGAMAAALAILAVTLDIGLSIDKIIISSIMILLPGVAITNAVRDSISGDLISGLTRAAEAFIVAISIAVGVGLTMHLWIQFLGGSL